MAPTLELTIAEDETKNPVGPLSDWQRRRILITAAATVAAGAPVRIIDIRVAPQTTKAAWANKSRGRKPLVRQAAWQRSRLILPAAPGPEPHEVETIS